MLTSLYADYVYLQIRHKYCIIRFVLSNVKGKNKIVKVILNHIKSDFVVTEKDDKVKH
jgi:hypothetical protein